MKITAEPRSDQWNADDFIGGPRTFTIAGVKVGSAEQKYDIELVEGEGRSWRPPLTMLRLLIFAWGDDSTTWTGRRVTLYRDDSIRFGPDEVGGIRVSHLSHIDKPITLALTATRGKKKKHTAAPLKDEPAAKPAPAEKPLPERIDAMLKAFEGIGITEAQITTKLGKPITEWSAPDVEQMTVVFSAIKKGNSTAAEAFPVSEDDLLDAAREAAEGGK